MSRPDDPHGHDYWDENIQQVRGGSPLKAWRAFEAGVFTRLIAAWFRDPAPGPGLKTDLFEEAVSPHHVLPELGAEAIGLDVSPVVVKAARAWVTAQGSTQRYVVGDLRLLPLRSDSIGWTTSFSTLDHFDDRADIRSGLAELSRVLAPGGTLLVTFDNPNNPVVWLRNVLPFDLLHRLGLVPYFVGPTYGAREASRQIESLGLIVTDVTAITHVPRAPAILLVRLAEGIGWPPFERAVARLINGFEWLGHLPTRYFTGYYVAVRATKKPLSIPDAPNSRYSEEDRATDNPSA